MIGLIKHTNVWDTWFDMLIFNELQIATKNSQENCYYSFGVI